MLNISSKVLMVAASYSPLLAVVSLELLYRGDPFWIWYLFSACLMALVQILILKVTLSNSIHHLRIGQLDDSSSDVVAYLLTYVVGFFALRRDLEMGWPAIAFLLVFVVFLSVKYEQYTINPVLAVMGYRVYRVTTEGGMCHILISKRRPIKVGEVLQVVRLSLDVVLEKTK